MTKTRNLEVTAALKSSISHFSPQMRIAGKYVVDHPAAFGLDSIRETARKAHVSTYTLVKLAKALDFASFEALRQPFRQALVATGSGPAKASWLSDLQDQAMLDPGYATAVTNLLSITSQSLERQEMKQLQQVADMLVSAPNVYVTAARSSYAIAHHLHYVGQMALPGMQLIPKHGASAIDALNDIKEGDVLIAITVAPYSIETIEACRFIKNQGMKLLLLTDSELVSPDLTPDHTLVASVTSTYNLGSFSGLMVLAELLISILMARGGRSAEQRVNSYEKRRLENNAYWRRQK